MRFWWWKTRFVFWSGMYHSTEKQWPDDELWGFIATGYSPRDAALYLSNT